MKYTITKKIEAPPQKIWDILKNVEEWNRWDSEILRSSGPFKEGAAGSISPLAGPASTMYFWEIKEGKNFIIRVPIFLCSLFINHKIEEISKNACLVHYIVSFRGFLGFIFSRTLGKKLAEGFRNSLSQLKIKAERDMNPCTLITGASSGLGESFCHEFGKRHRDLILVARNKQKLEALKKELIAKYPIEVHVLPWDLSQRENVKKLKEDIKKKNLAVDTLINNAGFGIWENFHNYPVERDEDMIQLNVGSLTSLTKLFLAEFKNQELGKILNTASTAAFLPGPLAATYFATKSFVLNFSLGVSFELKKEGSNIYLGVLCPGPTKTNFFQAAGMQETKLSRNAMTKEEVTAVGMENLDRQKGLSIAGSQNKNMISMSRFVSRNTLMESVYKMNKKMN